METNTKITEQEATEWYDDFLDQEPDIMVGGLFFAPSRILKNLDPIAYKCGFTEYVDYLADIDVEVEGFEQ